MHGLHIPVHKSNYKINVSISIIINGTKFQHHLYDSHLQKPWLKMEFIFSLPGVYQDW